MIFDACLVQCPYCFEQIEVDVDPTEADQQEFVYDCEVCCRPIQMQVFKGEEGESQIMALRDDSIG